MENSNNQHFYKMTESQIEDYKKPKGKKNYGRFTCRIEDRNLNKMRSIPEFENVTFQKKGNNFNSTEEYSESRDKTIEYNYTSLHFDNSKSDELRLNHLVIICIKGKEEEIKTLLSSHFDVIYRKGGNSITTKIEVNDKPKRGLWIQEKPTIVKYPICIVSFGRHNEFGRTHNCLTRMKIPHFLFVEPSEETLYREWYEPEYCSLVVSNEDFSKRKMGSTPMRNYIMDYHKNDHERVWMLDDNISHFQRYYQGVKEDIEGNIIFTSVEDYIEDYTNVGIVSHNLASFVTENDCRSVIVKNGKCYSSMLLPTRNDKIRFEYRHQEDNFISMKTIELGLCNLCFNSVLYYKNTSGVDGGGNSGEIYKRKDKEKDGKGYEERYKFIENEITRLVQNGELTLRDGKEVGDFIKRSSTMKSKEYHASLDYTCLSHFQNNINYINGERERVILTNEDFNYVIKPITRRPNQKRS